MAALFVRPDSPYYWIMYYDSQEPVPSNRKKRLSTKIEVTESDLRRFLDWRDKGANIEARPRVQGNKEVNELLKKISAGLVEKKLFDKFGIKIKKGILLSVGFEEFLLLHPDYAENTIKAKRSALSHLIKAVGNKNIDLYADYDYSKLIEYFRKKGFSQSGMNIHTAHLSALFNYFVKKKYCNENIIQVIKPSKGIPKPLTDKELQKILIYYEEKAIKYHYYLVYFLVLTGMRISSALAQRWEMINFANKTMQVINVKAKRKRFYFPLYPELENLLRSMNPQKNGRLFPEFEETGVPKFFQRDMKLLYERGAIGQKYTFHNLRDTFASMLANKNIDRSIVKDLLDHSSVAVTSEFYTEITAKTLKNQFKKIVFRKPKKASRSRNRSREQKQEKVVNV